MNICKYILVCNTMRKVTLNALRRALIEGSSSVNIL